MPARAFPKRAQERIFERFARTDASRSRRLGGSGLGLSIVAAIARAHGGSCSVRSTEGLGSVFELRLPLARPGGAVWDEPAGLRPEAVPEPVAGSA